MNTLHLRPVNPDVHSVHLANGSHVGNLKRVGSVWKFKAIGYDDSGAMEPGGGPLTEQHNMLFDGPDEQALNVRLGCWL